MEKEMITSLIVSSSSLLVATLSTFYTYRLKKRVRDIESSRLTSGLLNSRMEVLKQITRSLSRIDRVIMSSRLDRQKCKNEIIDKTSQAYLSTKAVFDENFIFLPEPVTENLVKEKKAIDDLIRQVKANLAQDNPATYNPAIDETFLELLQREHRWIDSVEKNFKQQLEVCITKVNSILN